jgi:hypothetical protein
MKTWQLAALAALTILATGKIVGAAGLIDWEPGPPAGFEVCMNDQGQLDLCRMRGYTGKLYLKPTLPARQLEFYAQQQGRVYSSNPEERRHQEMLDAIRDLKR